MWLNMPEMGACGEAEVLDIGPAQVYDVRSGLVTGTFRHTSGEVYDLKLASESKPIGVTGSHPFWSVSREAWVSVLDLEIGETLKTLEGTTVVESRVRRLEPEPVYNIEVEGDLCYRVGESGVLVHNSSTLGALNVTPIQSANQFAKDSCNWRWDKSQSDTGFLAPDAKRNRAVPSAYCRMCQLAFSRINRC